ncbi:MFS transporter [Pseudomonas sp. 2995-3]|uniref:MFS transporter n=1 Tax=Pseudomonas sp. 2995-3 TaxID=1712680 RepID=UPI0003195E3C|nr:MFS transporter [Pseudomonas sp. 2995-3]PIB70268.1 MFS transporter [Pseudomonas sp. 2995-3]
MRKFGWYSELGRKEKRTYWACFGGLALDSMDSTIFALVMPVLITVLGITKGEAGILGSVALVGSAIGGWGAGLLADRYGRVRMMQITIVWVAAATLMAGACSEFWEFFIARALQGIGYGGEAAVGAVLISETIAPRLRGRVAASVQSGYALGYAMSTLAMPLIFAFAPEHIAWRLFFAIGVLPALFVWFIRRLVVESDVFNANQELAKKTNKRSDFRAIFRGPHLRVTIIGTLLASGILGGAYVLITWLPTYLRMVLGLPITSTAGYLAVNIFGSLVGPVVYGILSDRIGRGRTFMVFLALQTVNVAVYLFAAINPSLTLVMGFALGLCQAALASGLTPSFAELYPTAIRASGAGFCTSFGRGIGSIVPAAVGLLSTSIPLGTAMGICAITSYGIGFLAAIMLPNATGVDMSAADQSAAIINPRAATDETSAH